MGSKSKKTLFMIYGVVSGALFGGMFGFIVLGYFILLLTGGESAPAWTFYLILVVGVVFTCLGVYINLKRFVLPNFE